MGDIETAVRGTQQLEALLEQKFGASGRGLHEKLSSVERQLPKALVRRMRWIATVRNEVVHEAASIRDLREFKRAVTECSQQLSDTERSAVSPASSTSAARAMRRERRRGSAQSGRANARSKTTSRGRRSRSRSWALRLALLALGLSGIGLYLLSSR
ncbi:MAG TPA: hypothetical protein VFQ61_28560 [Polyangiaceae bacterium]|nr:hypothetical protein [Polyangiaceae bacterium]